MKITLIGAGNLATNLALALKKANHEILQVYSRTEESARELAQKLSLEAYTTDLAAINSDSDIYIVALTDNALTQLAPTLSQGRTSALWLHTAGSIPMDTFTCERRGVMYPMQTFSKERIVDFSNIPVFIEASRPEDVSIVKDLAYSITKTVIELSSNERKYLHLAAVFCCNFPNHFATIASQILQEHNIPFSVMLPLIDETIGKLHNMQPRQAQTGPAVRRDQKVMQAHIDILIREQHPELAHIYNIISKSIQDYDQL